ncbi:hypothetical protein WDW37_00465 [Bdellovibrionota bacterium FG-1]
MAANKGSSHSKPTSKTQGQKTRAKEPQKGSKLAALKSAIFGAAKHKAQVTRHAHAHAPAKGHVKVEKRDHKPLARGFHKSKGVAEHDTSKKGLHEKAAPAPKESSAKTTSKSGTHKPSAASKSASSANHDPLHRKAPGTGRGKKAVQVNAATSYGINLGSGRISYDSNGEAVCREVACEGLATSNGYCRLHYIKNWKKIKRKEVILKEGKLNQYIEELVVKYPEKYIEAIRQDLANDKDFAKVIYDLDLDESVDDFDAEGESVDAVIGDIKRDFDDEGDGF